MPCKSCRKSVMSMPLCTLLHRRHQPSGNNTMFISFCANVELHTCLKGNKLVSSLRRKVEGILLSYVTVCWFLVCLGLPSCVCIVCVWIFHAQNSQRRRRFKFLAVLKCWWSNLQEKGENLRYVKLTCWRCLQNKNKKLTQTIPVWNVLPISVAEDPTPASFKRKLKTFSV